MTTWNVPGAGIVEGHADGTIVHRFALSVAAARAREALRQGDRTLSYDELDRRSNQLAHLLRRRGADRGDVIALQACPSTQALIAILAILKIGAAYAPIDPSAPVAYGNSLLRDCHARFLLSAVGRIAAPSVPMLELTEAIALAGSESDAAIPGESRPSDIAYVMHTSGSTGQPKAVAVPHRAVVRLVTDQTYARFASDEVFLHAAPLAFDASTFEIWGALLHGAQCAIVEGERSSLKQIADAIRQHKVTTAWFTAGLFNLMVDHQLDALTGLRHLLAGGDVLSPTHVTRALSALPECQLVNGYGPTENTTFTCCYRIPHDGWGGGPVPIGTPIRGTYVRLLDSEMREVSDGEVGMLYAGGLGVASGYLGDPAQSAAKFIADPMRAGAVLYETGDLARRRPDGNLDFLGRRDRQVKIDGKRVEPGEIEDILRQCPGVADAVVKTARGSALMGYVTPKAADCESDRLASEVRAHAAAALPAHMRPAQLVVLQEFPLNANGKVDHDRLPALQVVPPTAETAADNSTERSLLAIFQRVMGRPVTSVDASFFDLGATSLNLVEAHAEIARTWPAVKLVTLFQHPSIRALARALTEAPRAADAVAQRAQQRAEALRRLRRPR
ncbi:MAG: non-ribosomal peptide synthetase [Enhydrobacter sp.]|nr:non-ribosomal peptide synthetase [Enhydrobacter sp.]